MFKSIRYRIVFIFVLSISFFFLVAGYSLNWTIRHRLEKSLGEKLSTVAQSCSALLTSSELIYLQKDSGPRLKERIESKLHVIYDLEGIKRIFLFDLEDQILIDINQRSIGIPGPDLYFFQKEISDLQNQKTSYSVLYQGIDGVPSMTGFAAIYAQDILFIGVGVEGNADFLDDVQNMQHQLILIGLIGIVASVLIAMLLSNTITKPIRLLVSHSNEIAAGNYKHPVTLQTHDELGNLSQTMEEMRKNILAREAELKMMLSGVAHEIRNPLGGMALFTDLLAEKVEENPSASTYVDRIQREIQHLQNIVHRFLDFARPAKPSLQKVHLVSILEECIDLNQETIKSKSIEISQNVQSDFSVLADPNHVKEIFLNLLQNAVDVLSSKGKIMIHASLTESFVKVEVIDSGPGITKEEQDKIFDPFFSTRTEGTGLGLSIAKSLAKSNEGDVVLERSDGNGTVFHVFLRLYK